MSSDLDRLTVAMRTGSERFHANGSYEEFDLCSFWRWSTSDLVSNVTRGVLAEFIVAKGLGIDTASPRQEWRAYDLETGEGIKVEVKSAAYVQSWNQRRLSAIQFGVPKTRSWDADSNRQSRVSRRHADVYVFALLAHRDKQTIDPMDLNQWQFYLLPTKVLDRRTRSQHSITLPTLERLSTGPVSYHDLRDAFDDLLASQETEI